MDRFSKYNPKVTFLFFLFEILLTILVFNPVLLAASTAAALLYKLKLGGGRGVLFLLKVILPVMAAVTLFNFLFSHFGATVLFTLGETGFTAQSLFYGFTQSLMLSGVIAWFSDYTDVVTSERFLSVFGRLAPNTALVFSLVLSFLPRLRRNAAEIADARRLITDSGRLRAAGQNLSALVSMTLEESIQTAESMKARGFKKSRMVYSRYPFCVKDAAMLALMSVLFAAAAVLRIKGDTQFIYDPFIKNAPLPLWGYFVFTALSMLPFVTDLAEDIKWHYLKRKI